MDFLIPYTKEITFDSKIASIESISLEHEMNINEGEILGNFIVSGEYKTHELSVNKESFEHTIPFNIDLPNNIDKDTINFEITDFTYEILNDMTLKVIIEVNLKGKEIIEPPKDIIEEQLEREEEVFTPIEEDTTVVEDVVSKPTLTETPKINQDEEYITFHIHIYKENEDLESICSKYNSNINLLKDYNDLSNLKPNDKLIIPEEDE